MQSLRIWCCNVLSVTSYPNSFRHLLEDRSLGTEAMSSAIQVDTEHNFQLWHAHVKLSPVSTISYCPIFFVCVVIGAPQSLIHQSDWRFWKATVAMPTKLITLTGGGPWGFTLSRGKDFGAHPWVFKVSKMMVCGCVCGCVHVCVCVVCVALYPGLLDPAFVACSTNAGEGLVKLSHMVWCTWMCGRVAPSRKNVSKRVHYQS